MIQLPPMYTDAQWASMSKETRAAAWSVAIEALKNALSSVVAGTPFAAERFDAIVDSLKQAIRAREDCLR